MMTEGVTGWYYRFESCPDYQNKIMQVEEKDLDQLREELFQIMRRNYPKGKEKMQREFVSALSEERASYYIKSLDDSGTKKRRPNKLTTK